MGWDERRLTRELTEIRALLEVGKLLGMVSTWSAKVSLGSNAYPGYAYDGVVRHGGE